MGGAAGTAQPGVLSQNSAISTGTHSTGPHRTQVVDFEEFRAYFQAEKIRKYTEAFSDHDERASDPAGGGCLETSADLQQPEKGSPGTPEDQQQQEPEEEAVPEEATSGQASPSSLVRREVWEEHRRSSRRSRAL